MAVRKIRGIASVGGMVAVALLVFGAVKLHCAWKQSDGSPSQLIVTTVAARPEEPIQAKVLTEVAMDLIGRPVPVSVERADNQSMTPVSMTPVGGGKYLIANYRNIYLFDTISATAVPLTLNVQVPSWNPTAVYYSPFYDQVFIANYTGKDVLIASLVNSGGKWGLELDSRLQHPEGIKGPEGIVVSKGGRYMALADYDGGALSLFERVDAEWQFRWKQPVVASHGVAIIGDFVYGSGTTIAKFEIKTGKEVARTGNIGDDSILFATCLDYDESTGNLFGSDTMAGKVFSMDLDLRSVSVFGSNGPTTANLSMPYCAYRDKKETWILSTYQERVIRIADGRTTSFEMRKDYWPYLDATLPDQALGGRAWHGVTKVDHPIVSLFGKKVNPSYGAVSAEDGTSFVLPTRRGTLSAGWLHYVTTTAKRDDWTIIASLSAPAAFLINQKTGELAFAETEFDCWAAGSDLLCPSRRFRLDGLLARAKRVMPIGDIDAIARSMGVDRESLLQDFSSSGGVILRRAIQDGHSEDGSRAYLSWADGKTVPLIEYWIATALAGKKL